jgi:hypothetical protein
LQKKQTNIRESLRVAGDRSATDFTLNLRNKNRSAVFPKEGYLSNLNVEIFRKKSLAKKGRERNKKRMKDIKQLMKIQTK